MSQTLPTALPKDREHLRILAIFHYILGGLLAGITLLNVFFLWNMVRSFSAFQADVAREGFEPVQSPSWMYTIGATWIVLCAVAATCLLVAARLLQRQHGYRFVYVIACIECLAFPLGTVLGVFTLIVLSRASVKQLFGGNVKL